MFTHTAKQIYAEVLKAKNILIIPHQHPDGDTLGTSTACSQFLRRLKKKHTIFSSTPLPGYLSYLPHIQSVIRNEAVWQDQTIDLIIVFDSGDLQYAGVHTYIEALSPVPTIINIDHHNTNQYFGTHNLVVTTASSTAEVLVRFFKANQIDIDPIMATCLMTGLITDTDNFTNSATKPETVALASELITLGADFNRIKTHVYKQTPLTVLKLWGTVFSRLQKHTTYDIVYTYITQQDLTDHQLSEDQSEGMANFLNMINDGKAGLILKERADGTIKGSFRTTLDTVDVSLICKTMGGGGHKKAAGFSLPGPIDKALEKIFMTVDTLVVEGKLFLS